jgi:hypothetical protein
MYHNHYKENSAFADNDVDDPQIFGKERNYAAVLAKQRPVTPPDQP